jgi:hypothetical protein
MDGDAWIWNGHPGLEVCICCKAMRSAGHYRDCELAALRTDRDRLAGELEAARETLGQSREAYRNLDAERNTLQSRTALLVGQLATAREALIKMRDAGNMPAAWYRSRAEETVTALALAAILPAVSPAAPAVTHMWPAVMGSENITATVAAVSPGVPVLDPGTVEACAKVCHDDGEGLLALAEELSPIQAEKLRRRASERFAARDRIRALSAPLPSLPVEPTTLRPGERCGRLRGHSADNSHACSATDEAVWANHASPTSRCPYVEPAPPEPGKQQP